MYYICVFTKKAIFMPNAIFNERFMQKVNSNRLTNTYLLITIKLLVGNN